MHLTVLRGVLLCLLVTSGLAAAGARTIEPVQGALGISDPQFARNAGENEERAMHLVSESDFEGLLLDAPRRVRLKGESDTLPMIGVRASSIRDNRLVSLHRRTLVVALLPESDKVLAATVFRIKDDDEPPPAPKDDASIPKGQTVKAFQFLLNGRIEDLPQGPGPLRAVLLLYDRRSNTVDVTREGKAATDRVTKDAWRPAMYPSTIHPPVPAPAAAHPYRKQPGSPSLPAGTAIALAADPTANGFVRGTFELPVQPRDMVRPIPGPPGPSQERSARAAGWVEVGDPDAAAVLPITLLLTGDEDAEPILVPMRVPVYGRLEKGKGGVVGRGHFSLDLRDSIAGGLRAQRYAVWAFSRLAISAPALVNLTGTTAPR